MWLHKMGVLKMQKETTIRIRIEPELKEKTKVIFNKMGLNISQAVRLFLKQVELHNGLPFELSIPNETTIKTLKDTDKGKNLVECKDVDDMFDKLQI